MKYWSLALFVAFVGIFSLISCGKSERSRKPIEEIKHEVDSIRKAREWKFIFKYKDVNVGRIDKKKDTACASFKFTNTTNKNQFIDTVETSCGCAIADFPRHVIRPGESGEVTVSIDLRDTRGSFTKQSWVFFHDKGARPVVLTVSGEKV